MISDICFWLLVISGWVTFSVLLSSFMEWILHGTFMHHATWMSRYSSYMDQLWKNHLKFHHGDCFHGDHFEGKEGECLTKGTLFYYREGILGSSPLWGTLAVLGFCYIHSTIGPVLIAGALIYLLVLVGHFASWNWIHIQMHTRKEKRSPRFYKSRICLVLARFHFLHHYYPRCNHCIVFPFADYIMGTAMKPSAKDVERMREHGLYGL